MRCFGLLSEILEDEGNTSIFIVIPLTVDKVLPLATPRPPLTVPAHTTDLHSTSNDSTSCPITSSWCVDQCNVSAKTSVDMGPRFARDRNSTSCHWRVTPFLCQRQVFE